MDLKPNHLSIAVIGLDLKVRQIIDWDRTFKLNEVRDPTINRLVDISSRPDIAVGDAFPFGPKKE